MLSARPAWMFSASPMLGVASILRLLVVSPVVRNLRGLLFGGGGLGRKAEAPDGTVFAVLPILLGSPSQPGAANPTCRVLRGFSAPPPPAVSPRKAPAGTFRACAVSPLPRAC